MSATALKVFALLLMFLDHVGEFIPGAPLFLRYFGRLSAPLFMFCSAWGFAHTSDRRKYLTRLYGFGVGMAVVSMLLNHFFRFNALRSSITNNFFTTLFLTWAVVAIIESKDIRLYALFAVWQALAFLLSALLSELLRIPNFPTILRSYRLWGSVFGSILVCEGGPLFVTLGVCLYFARSKKPVLIMGYALFSAGILFLTRRYGHIPGGPMAYIVPFSDFQWMMIGALPFMLAYNGQRGKGLKYLFYWFYPVHIVLLYLLGQWIASMPQ